MTSVASLQVTAAPISMVFAVTRTRFNAVTLPV